ncbi:MAG: cytochrome c biogenesis CcdA family protein [Beijerinckiaceae bacterium]
MLTTLTLAALAGVLSTLSPCVLPILPIVLGTAASEHRMGPFALAAGLALSFVAIGMFVATIGFSIGLNGDFFRIAAAALMIIIGVVLVVPQFSMRLAAAGGPAGNWMEQRFGGFSSSGLKGQFTLGLLLGAVWSPCVGPTLGAASVLAARGESLGQVSLTMLAFGIGAGLPLILLGMLSREALLKWRNRMLEAGSKGKMIFGAVLLTAGILVISGLDKKIEGALVSMSPEWLTELTTRF